MPNETKTMNQSRKNNDGTSAAHGPSSTGVASTVSITHLRTNKHRTPSWWFSVILTYLFLAAGAAGGYIYDQTQKSKQKSYQDGYNAGKQSK